MRHIADIENWHQILKMQYKNTISNECEKFVNELLANNNERSFYVQGKRFVCICVCVRKAVRGQPHVHLLSLPSDSHTGTHWPFLFQSNQFYLYLLHLPSPMLH